jgi:hypothetical protein
MNIFGSQQEQAQPAIIHCMHGCRIFVLRERFALNTVQRLHLLAHAKIRA